jgi:hypothetical protein
VREARPYQLVLTLFHGGSDVHHEVELLLMRPTGEERKKRGWRRERWTR